MLSNIMKNGNNPFKVNNLKQKQKKLHEIYVSLYGQDFEINRGYEIDSTAYQLRLARAVLQHVEQIHCSRPIKFILKIRGGTIIYRGNKTREEVMVKYKTVLV